MRARNIKPDFFRDAELSEVSIEARYLFVGLWCMADREGKLRDKPKQIRFEVFPETKTKDNIEALLEALVRQGQIVRYSVDDHKYIKVVNFLKHQSPHHTEKKSEIPEPTVSHGELPLSSVNIPLIPDSLIPDSLIPDSRTTCSESAPPTTEPPPEPIIEIPLIPKDGSYPITQSQADDWQAAFPGIDVMQSLRNIRQWNHANPTKRKTRSGIQKHIVSWLTKEQDRCGGRGATTNRAPPGQPQTYAQCQDLERRQMTRMLKELENADRDTEPDISAVDQVEYRPFGSKGRG